MRAEVLSFSCRRRKRTQGQHIVMQPAKTRFLTPCDVLEMGIHDMKHCSDAGKRFLPLVVDRATKFFLFERSLPSKEAIRVSNHIVAVLCLLFSMLKSIRSNSGTKIIANLVHAISLPMTQQEYLSQRRGRALPRPRRESTGKRCMGPRGTLGNVRKCWAKRWDEYSTGHGT